MKLGFIGGGNMAQAMIIGLKTQQGLNQQFAMQNITVIELDANIRAELSKNLGINTTDCLSGIQACDVIV